MVDGGDGPALRRSGIGRSLRQWRAVRRCKQTHVAAELSVSQATVSRWENGDQCPRPHEAARLVQMLGARLTAASDRQLARLVGASTLPVHLVCDLTHRLLACSSVRATQLHRDPADLMGISLWPAATPDIAAAEDALSGLGWYDGRAVSCEAHTRAQTGDLMDVRPGRFRWTRFRLADGTFARLVETIGDDGSAETVGGAG